MIDVVVNIAEYPGVLFEGISALSGSIISCYVSYQLIPVHGSISSMHLTNSDTSLRSFYQVWHAIV